MPELNLREAICTVLREASEPLRYQDIANIIASEGLFQFEGATSDRSVASELSRMIRDGKPIDRLGGGHYACRRLRPIHEEDDADDASLTIAAYGLHWEREKVAWNTARQDVRLLGRQNQAAAQVNFADQQGVYLLHHMRTVTYVGRTSAENNGLFGRLKSHTKNLRRSGRWDRFSWFGIRPVHDSGDLLPAPPNLTADRLINIVEAVLIETYLPAFNDKSGDLMGALYEQVVDPEIARQRAQAILREATGN